MIFYLQLIVGSFCDEGCEAPEVCEGPFILDNGVQVIDVGYYCVDPSMNNPVIEGCEDVIQIYPVLPTEGSNC